MTEQEIMRQLQEPFPLSDLEFRISRTAVYGDRIVAWYLTYVTARAIQRRLDDVLGIGGWTDEYRVMEVPGGQPGIICRLKLRMPDGSWIAKEDGAPQTGIESFKGGISDALKRAAAQAGIGRYLYDLPENYAIISDKKSDRTPYRAATSQKDGRHPFYWGPRPLPDWALPSANSEGVPQVAYSDPETTSLPDDVKAGEKAAADDWPSKDEILAKVKAARARPHLENIFRKYRHAAKSGGWLGEFTEACKARDKELKGAEGE